jgi:ketosteroid isomerase-like protein
MPTGLARETTGCRDFGVRDPDGYILRVWQGPVLMTVAPVLVEQMRAALDAHDLDAFVEFFHEDYLGERPRHPDAPPSTREEVRGNWTEVLRDVPDLRVEIPASVQEGNTIWSEWRAYGTALSGATLELRGVIIFGIQDDQVAWSRMYLEPVEQEGVPLTELTGVGPHSPG